MTRPHKHSHTLLLSPSSGTRALMFGTASLLILLAATASPWVYGETSPPPDSAGIYSSDEGAVHSPAQQGSILSLPALPDPSTALTGKRSSASGIDGDDGYAHINYLQDAWITDVGLLLFNDSDNDGYFAGFSLSVDADTAYHDLDVYLSIDVQRDFHSVERLHTSAIFPLYGQSAADEYRIDIELVRNYAVAHYDLILELRDAYDHQLLERVSSAQFSNLRSLPLESEDQDRRHDDPSVWPLAPDYPVVNDDIHVVEYAGSLGGLMSSVLTLMLLVRRLSSASRHRHRPEA